MRPGSSASRCAEAGRALALGSRSLVLLWTGVYLLAHAVLAAGASGAAQQPQDAAGRPAAETATGNPAVPGIVIDHSPASSGLYIGSPALALLPDGRYLASHDLFGPNSREFERPSVLVFRSADKGATWSQVARVEGLFWASLFVHRGAVYLMGTDKHHGRIVIRRSTDGGASWTEPKDARSGLLTPTGQYHTAPVPVLEHQGRLWRAFEDAGGGTRWGERYRAGMLSLSAEADLLTATNWAFSNFLPRNAEWLGGQFGGWLEGNAVVTPGGAMADVLRVDTPGLPEKAALVEVSPDGRSVSFEPSGGFIDMPGGAKKFSIRQDPQGKGYWTLASIAPTAESGPGRDQRRAEKPAAIRNTLALLHSPDLRHWEVRSILLHHPEAAHHGFQYVDWQFEGDDIIAVCRTACDDGLGGAHNYHDANFLTFHRIKRFRTLTRAPAAAAAKQLTSSRRGHILTNTGVWSPDGQWIVYDTRSDAPGAQFDGETIEMVNVESGEVRELYRATNGAHCGVVTFHPHKDEVVFILGPEHPTPDWQYGPARRQGVVVGLAEPGRARNLDARDLTPPFTPGALRGGSHVHVWDAAGQLVSFTYEDEVLSRFRSPSPTNDINQRNVGVSVAGHPVKVARDHPRNHDGDSFSVLVTRTVANPHPGSDELLRACEEGWVGTNGYARADGSRQARALAFQGSVVAAGGETVAEVFIADLPADLTRERDGPLCGTETRAPFPPLGVAQRRLTFTAERKFPGLQGPRHWLRSSPDGSRIAFLMKDDQGVAQLWTVSPNGGPPHQLTHNSWPIASAFTWSPDGRQIAHVMDQSVCVTDTASGETARLTPRSASEHSPRPEACVFSPEGNEIAFLKPVQAGKELFNQVFIVKLDR